MTTITDTMSETQVTLALGGRGGVPSTLDLAKLKDLRLVKKALKERWPIDPANRPAIAKAVAVVAASPGGSARKYRTAVECLLLMVQQDRESFSQVAAELSAEQPAISTT